MPEFKTEDILKRSLEGFSRPSEEEISRVNINNNLGLESKRFPVPELLQRALVGHLGLNQMGPFEKVRWSIPFLFEGKPHLLELRKFGLFLCFEGTVKPEGAVVDALEQALLRAAKVTERELQVLAKGRLREGFVTIRNDYPRLSAPYMFFREKAREAYSGGDPPLIVEENDGITMSSMFWGQGVREGAYLTTAMLDAYFSRLEHALVLALAFVDFEPKDNALVEAIGMDWGTKYQVLFKSLDEAGVNRCYQMLREMKEEYLNRASHGGFEKRGRSLYFHVEGLGALPVRLRNRDDGWSTLFEPVPESTFEDICAKLSQAERFLAESQLRPAFRIIEAGVDISFDPRSRAKYRDVAQNDRELEKFIDRQIYLKELHVNMDY